MTEKTLDKEFINVFLVPTGVGASIGGFAGDASCYARKISEVSTLIVNPNVVNAAVFSGINDKMLYTEGFLIDSFFKSEIALQTSRNNKIGVIFDKEIPQNVYNVHINTLNAVKTVYGVDVLDVEVTEENVGVGFEISEEGFSTGTLKNPETLLKSAKKLIDKGAQAIAVICLFPEAEDDGYSNGEGVDIVGGVEAIISHLISREYNIPVAHAPVFVDISICEDVVDKRASAEYITPTFLPCILLGLQNAPQIHTNLENNHITVNDIKSLIVPHNSLGSIPVLRALELGIPVLAVEENSTVLDVTAEKLKLDSGIIKFKTYDDVYEYLKKIKETL